MAKLRSTTSWLVILFVQVLILSTRNAHAKIPAIIVFGDSSVDAGNNNYIPTVARSNFQPYGRDFAGGRATGRFSNGRIASDFISEALGLKPTIPAYLDPAYNISDFAVGVTFASAGTGYDNATSDVLDPVAVVVLRSGSAASIMAYMRSWISLKGQFVSLMPPVVCPLQAVIPLWKEVEYYKDYRNRLRSYLGETQANQVITEALHMISIGTNDFLENYYAFPGRSSQYTISQYQDFLAGIAENFVKEIYGLGARKISLGGLPPMGCMPLERNRNMMIGRNCVESYNVVAVEFNGRLSSVVGKLSSELPGIKLVFSNPYDILMHIINRPSQYGFQVAGMACCATGMFEMGYACNRDSPFTCTNADKYVFWDSFHPTQRTNQIISDYVVKNVLNKFM